MSKCRACGKDYRTGVLVTLLDADASSGGRQARVCKRCAQGGMLVVAPRVVSVGISAKTDAGVREHPLALHIAGVVRQLRLYARVARASALKAPESTDDRTRAPQSFFIGRAEGFESAVELLKLNSGRLLP